MWLEHVIRQFLKIGLIFYDLFVPNQVEDECSQDNDNRQSHKQRCAFLLMGYSIPLLSAKVKTKKKDKSTWLLSSFFLF
jgi:hypothetical protein